MVTSADVLAALRTRFAPPEWLMFSEVRNATGYGAAMNRTADAIAMNCWPSRTYGHELHGVEIKTSRSDWLTERADPTKAAPFRRHCDRWWLATTPGIVRPDEIDGFGLMVLGTDGVLTVECEAPVLGSEPVSRAFLASLLRSASRADERTEAEAVHAALLRAPLRPVVRVEWMSHGRETGHRLHLSCGHVVAVGPAARKPRAARCLDCGDAANTRSA